MTSTRNITIPFTINKIDEEQRRVWGIATSEALDSQGDVLDYTASKKAITEWMKIGNIREMHDEKKAVGKAFDAQFDDKKKNIIIGSYISRSTDGENTWQKLKEGILTGYSVGGKVKNSILDKVEDTGTGLKVDAKRVTDWAMSELSLVDNPANPTAQILMVKSKDGNSIDYIDLVKLNQALDDRLAKSVPSNAIPLQPTWWMGMFQNPDEREQAIRKYQVEQMSKLEKRDYNTKQRQGMADNGQAMSDGSFPIKDKVDLANAIKAYGRAKNKAKAKAHIESRAKALGATNMLPDNWDEKVEETEMTKMGTADKPVVEKDVKKDIGGVLTLARTALDLQYFLDCEVREEDSATVKAVADSLVALKEAMASELDEKEYLDAEVVDLIFMGQKAMDLAKADGRVRTADEVVKAKKEVASDEEINQVHSTLEGPSEEAKELPDEGAPETKPEDGAREAVDLDGAYSKEPKNDPTAATTEPVEQAGVTHASDVAAAKKPENGTGDGAIDAPSENKDEDDEKISSVEMKKSLSDVHDEISTLMEKSGMVKAVSDLTDLVKQSLTGQKELDERLKKFENKPQPIRAQASYTNPQEVIKGRENNSVDGDGGVVLKSNGMDEDEIAKAINRLDYLGDHPGEGDPRERGELFRKLWKVDVAAYRERLNIKK